jgi:hypothetical protein
MMNGRADEQVSRQCACAVFRATSKRFVVGMMDSTSSLDLRPKLLVPFFPYSLVRIHADDCYPVQFLASKSLKDATDGTALCGWHVQVGRRTDGRDDRGTADHSTPSIHNIIIIIISLLPLPRVHL